MNGNSFLEQDNPKLAKLERRIHSAMCSFIDAGEAFATIRDDPARLYAKHGTFEEYCRERWNLSRTYVHRLIEAAKVARRLEGFPGPKLEYESQARQLVGLDAKTQAEVWERANEIAKANGKSRATAKEIAAASRQASPPKGGDLLPIGNKSPPLGGSTRSQNSGGLAGSSTRGNRSPVVDSSDAPSQSTTNTPVESPRVFDPADDNLGAHDNPASHENTVEDAPRSDAENLNALKVPPGVISQTWNGAEMDWEIREVERFLALFIVAHQAEDLAEYKALQDCVGRLKSAWAALKRSAARAAASRNA